jgi:ABC-type transporter Mla MlaB component
MLKITVQTEETRTVLELEGKLAGPWVQELESCWQQVKAADRQLRISLKAVMFIDGAGKKLLAGMHRQGVELLAEGCMTKAIVDQIIRGESL